MKPQPRLIVDDIDPYNDLYTITPADEWKITFGILTIGEREIGKPIDFTPNGCPIGEGIANQKLIIAAPQMHEELIKLRKDKAELVEALDKAVKFQVGAYHSDKDRAQAWIAIKHELRAAIAKAEK